MDVTSVAGQLFKADTSKVKKKSEAIYLIAEAHKFVRRGRFHIFQTIGS
jgi:hypothetical protein